MEMMMTIDGNLFEIDAQDDADETERMINRLMWLEEAIGEAFWDTMREVHKMQNAEPSAQLDKIRDCIERIGDVLYGKNCTHCNGTGELWLGGDTVGCGYCRDGLVSDWRER